MQHTESLFTTVRHATSLLEITSEILAKEYWRMEREGKQNHPDYKEVEKLMECVDKTHVEIHKFLKDIELTFVERIDPRGKA